jgi:hypothetical protein
MTLGLAADLVLDLAVPLPDDAFAVALRHGSAPVAAPKRSRSRILSAIERVGTAPHLPARSNPPGGVKCHLHGGRNPSSKRLRAFMRHDVGSPGVYRRLYPE